MKPQITSAMTRAERKAERIRAWKREKTKSDRDKAKEERVKEWQAATGLEYAE